VRSRKKVTRPEYLLLLATFFAIMQASDTRTVFP
jgi:hypothetical protein